MEIIGKKTKRIGVKMGLNPVFEVSFEVKIQSEKAAAWGPPTGSLLFLIEF